MQGKEAKGRCPLTQNYQKMAMNIGKNNGKRGEVREKKEKLPKMQNSYCPPPPTGEKNW